VVCCSFGELLGAKVPNTVLALQRCIAYALHSKCPRELQGKEVVKMYDTILGREGFRKGMDLYFQRHDGSAVTCDDFLAAMADANNEDLSSLGKWCVLRDLSNMIATVCCIFCRAELGHAWRSHAYVSLLIA
jgi:hypothetical protein